MARSLPTRVAGFAALLLVVGAHAAVQRATVSSDGTAATGVPVIDLAAPEAEVADQVAAACSEWGFFEVTNHGVDPALIKRFEEGMHSFFALPMDEKLSLRRGPSNARGYFDDELTKQRRDWKEALDFGVPGSRDWTLPDEHASNGCLDGYNRFPDAASLPLFRPAMVDYFAACTDLSERIAALMSLGLGMPADHFSNLLRSRHTSYLRMNYYPVAPNVTEGTLGISPHTDAGFLTVLIQDDGVHSLQVRHRSSGEWTTVAPTPGALTINTGDMAQIWSNGRYRAPEHRVQTHPTDVRYSAPFFYNPGYLTPVAPLPSLGEPQYNPCVWGYFRAQRFAGDFADFGTEIQTSAFELGSLSPHLERQQAFLEGADPSEPFSVERYRHLLQMPARDAGAGALRGVQARGRAGS